MVSEMTNHRFPSNRATPVHYKRFREAVLRGDIPVCETISMEMNRIDGRIRNPEYYYDPRLVAGIINFAETELTKTDGSNLKVLETFKIWFEQLFGWYYYVPRKVWTDNGFEDRMVLTPLINKLYLIVGRGAAKSMFLSFIQAYFLTMDPETTNSITTAPTMRQAQEVTLPIKTAIVRSQGPYFNFLTNNKLRLKSGKFETLLSSTKKGIEFSPTASILEIRPMSIDKLQGLRPKISTVDEWLSGETREDPIGAIEQGASKLENYYIVAASSEGTIRNGVGDDIKLELLKILKGEYDDPHTCIFYYRMDDVKEVAHPELWPKAQPNIGITVSYEAYMKDKIRAENNPSARNDILAKRWGLPMTGHTYFFTYREIQPHPVQSYNNMDCAMGADLSQGDDFCSFTFLFPLGGDRFGIKTINYITERTLALLPTSMRIKYDSFIKEESLVILTGSILDIDEVFESLYSIITERGYNILAMGYDPYNAERFVDQFKRHYGAYMVELVRQGVRTESVPLGELKTLSEERLLLFDEEIFEFAMGNTMVLEDTNGNRKLYKRRHANKIDPVSALMDAWVAFKRRTDYF